jgi:protein DJ-1
MKIHVDTTDLPSDPGNYAIVTVPGGAKGAATLSESSPVQSLLQKFDKAGKLVGTICAGSLAVKTAGLVVGGKVTSHPSVEKEFENYEYSEDRVVVEGHVVSSRGYTA